MVMMMMISGRKKVLRGVFGALFFMGALWFLFGGIVTGHATITITSSTVPSVDNNQMLKHWNLNGRDQRHHSLRWASNLIYVSKRRVPNGPDPIHNRRAVKTRQPPGRA
ncbi:CLAVATA3/ESR (CLE)-related protein 25 [Ziziphus jujuba]|uniref:CLAVATA3/ESR (CLE)-related protein 25 n=1 Tax=Ziziphus jujuba TaxID=326968 RepID=A0A6P4A038_ZIZJJ|nr:CLAVATA3/ESR (CLE)-related protein 25 [Ziziphus jujuba]